MDGLTLLSFTQPEEEETDRLHSILHREGISSTPDPSHLTRYLARLFDTFSSRRQKPQIISPTVIKRAGITQLLCQKRALAE